jgi:ATP-GRASP peptide maturase of grasp-with-spasm system
MIHIISQSKEVSTDSVIDYLNFHAVAFERYNYEDTIQHVATHLSDEGMCFEIEIKNKKHTFCDKDFFWYRRGLLHFRYPFEKSEIPNQKMQKFLDDEWNFVNSFFFKHFNFIGSYLQENENNKLYNLMIAQKSGFRIPKTIVTTSKTEAITFIAQIPKCITKPLHNGHVNFEIDNQKMVSKGTQLVTIESVAILEDYFAAMLLQEYIEKEIELRIFFVDKTFYAMAIFSQNDAKTAIDYRNYNNEKPNRCVPFSLPKTVLQKLEAFVETLSLNTGSIDLIIDQSGNYCFLEINPSGQFDWLSKNCNYYLDEIIANHLITLSNG